MRDSRQSSVIPQLVTAAVVGIISPVAIMGAIALLASRRAVADLLAFLVGWNVVLIVVAVVVQLLFADHREATSAGAKGAVDFILGILLLVFGLRGLVGAQHPLKEVVDRRAEKAGTDGPAWLAKVTDAGPLQAFGFGM